MEPSFVQAGTIATNDCADLNRSLIVHSLSRKNGEPEDVAAIPDGMRVQKHIAWVNVPTALTSLVMFGHHAARGGQVPLIEPTRGGLRYIGAGSSPAWRDT